MHVGESVLAYLELTHLAPPNLKQINEKYVDVVNTMQGRFLIYLRCLFSLREVESVFSLGVWTVWGFSYDLSLF